MFNLVSLSRVFSLAIAVAATSIPALSNTFPDPKITYFLSTALLQEGHVLGLGAGNKLEMARRDGNLRQLWRFAPLGNGYYRITNAALGAGQSIDSDTLRPNLRGSGNYSGQQWKLSPAGNGYYRLSNMFQKEARPLETSGQAPYTLVLGERRGSPGQLWKLTPATSEIRQPKLDVSTLPTENTPTDTNIANTDISITSTTESSTPLVFDRPGPDAQPQQSGRPIVVQGMRDAADRNPEVAREVLAGFGPIGMSRATCGLFGQQPCGYEPAKLIGNALGSCPSGSFFDLATWACWTCPQGYERSAAAIDTDRACRKRDTNARGEFGPATFQGRVCPQGSFFDPIRDGECWSCPQGYRRSTAHIDATNACFIAAYEDFKRATRHKHRAAAWDCVRGTFWDGYNGGGCYSCPSGYRRTGYHINDAKACSRSVPEQQARASVVKKAECGPGEIKDLKIKGAQDLSAGGGCWTCPTAWDRTIHPIDGNRACEKDANFVFAQARMIDSLSCPEGQIFDFVSTKHPSVQAALRTRNTELRAQGKPLVTSGDGATCWQCPDTAIRTADAVYSSTACQINHIKWETAEYRHRGLFGLDGSDEVVLDLIRDGTLINMIADDLAPKVGQTVQAFRNDVWQEIATKPQSSDILKVAVLSRLLIAAKEPNKATPAERRLAESTAQAIQSYSVFLAQDAVDAYDAWAQGRDLAERTREQAESARHPMARSEFSGGAAFWENPPKFDEIIAASTLQAIAAGGGVSTAAAITLMTPEVFERVFPYLLRPHYIGGEGVLQAGWHNALPQRIAAKLKVQSVTGKTFGTVSRAIARAVGSTGPQIAITIVVELLSYTIERLVDNANARPILVTALASAKQPVSLQRMTATSSGESYLLNQWSIITSGETVPRSLPQISAAVRAVANN